MGYCLKVGPLQPNKKIPKGIEKRDEPYSSVQGMQIIRALNKELGVRFAKGPLYEMVQAVANEARGKGLLINPNPFDRTTYSTAVGNTDRMLPSKMGWEMTKGILWRHLELAKRHLKTK